MLIMMPSAKFTLHLAFVTSYSNTLLTRLWANLSSNIIMTRPTLSQDGYTSVAEHWIHDQKVIL